LVANAAPTPAIMIPWPFLKSPADANVNVVDDAEIVPVVARTLPDALGIGLAPVTHEDPRAQTVPLIVVDELASAEFGIAVKPTPIAPDVSVPTEVRDEPVMPDGSDVPVKPVDAGRPVAFVSVTAEGVPRFGVTRVGDVASTAAPVPVDVVAPVPPFAAERGFKSVRELNVGDG
jgi:hypothetical protein